jgi:hypothetical protein
MNPNLSLYIYIIISFYPLHLCRFPKKIKNKETIYIEEDERKTKPCTFYVDFHKLCVILHTFKEKEEWRRKRIKEQKGKKGKKYHYNFHCFCFCIILTFFVVFKNKWRGKQKKIMYSIFNQCYHNSFEEIGKEVMCNKFYSFFLLNFWVLSKKGKGKEKKKTCAWC